MSNTRLATVPEPGTMALIFPAAAADWLMLSGSRSVKLMLTAGPAAATLVTSPMAEPTLLVSSTRSPVFKPCAGSLTGVGGQFVGSGLGAGEGSVNVATVPAEFSATTYWFSGNVESV